MGILTWVLFLIFGLVLLGILIPVLYAIGNTIFEVWKDMIDDFKGR